MTTEWQGKLWALCPILALLWLAPPASAEPQTEIQIGAPFTLVDQHGRTRSDRDFSGSYMLIFFGFTHCPDTCPLALAKITDALDAFAERHAARARRITPLFISIDPERDSPAALKAYAEHFHPRLVALTGDADQLKTLGYAYGVSFTKVLTGDPGSYLMDHTAFIYLMGPDGGYITHFDSDVTAEDLAAALAAHVAADDRPS